MIFYHFFSLYLGIFQIVMKIHDELIVPIPYTNFCGLYYFLLRAGNRVSDEKQANTFALIFQTLGLLSSTAEPHKWGEFFIEYHLPLMIEKFWVLFDMKSDGARFVLLDGLVLCLSICFSCL